MNAVVGALGHQDQFAARGLARQCQRPGRYVGAVLGEHRPIHIRGQPDQSFGQLDHVGGRQVARIAKRQLFGHGPFHPRVAVTDHHRSVGAEQVDVTVAVGVLYAATLGGRYEDRVAATAEQSRVLVSVNATGDYGQRSLVKSLALFETFAHGRPLISEVRRP